MKNHIINSWIGPMARSVAAATLLCLSSAHAFAEPPSQPGELSYIVYSRTAAELFWNRSTDDTGVSGYEIVINGQIIDTFDGLSYFSDELIEGNTYEVAVTAIDNDGERSTPAAVSFIGGDRSTPADTTLLPPSNLTATVYSRTAAELFWDRSATPDQSYDVIRDGELVATTDGTSYYDSVLSEGTSYQYDVIAKDQTGAVSTAAMVSLTTNGDTTPVDTTLAAPSGLRASVYSSTAAELFWDRSTTFGLSYEITRDGNVVTTTDGTSYYADNLTDGTAYTYEVVALNAQGSRSAVSGVMFSTGGDDTPTDPTIDNPALSEPADLYTRDGYGTVNVVRLDIRTVTTPGVCTVDDLSGCTLADVIADIDGDDDFTVDIPIHFQGDDLPDDGSINNAELRQRGGFTRLAPQKSFRVKLDSKEELWRTERRLQLNKMPYDTSRIRNKLSFDLMSEIPNLPSLRTQFVNLWIDDGAGPEDYGLFTHTEYVGKEYLVNRERDTDDHIYKIEEFTFSPNDLANMELDEDGEPLDDDRFEQSLDIKSGDGHQKLLEMVAAVNDGTQTFESVFDRYFDEENVLTWLAVNFLLHQTDAVTHNFYLYNPVDSDKFYFLPWDYDGTFSVEQEPANSYERDELFRRLYYGYGKGRASNFLDQYYRQPGIHQKILAKAAELRNNQLMDSNILERASRYATVVSPYAGQSPDIDFNMSYAESNSNGFADFVAQSHSALQNFGIPLPPKYRSPQIDAEAITFRWLAAHDMNGGELTYDLEISSSPAFDTADRILLATGISELSYRIPVDQITSGTRYARLTARATSDPQRFWQTASNRPVIDGEMRIGVQEFTIP